MGRTMMIIACIIFAFASFGHAADSSSERLFLQEQEFPNPFLEPGSAPADLPSSYWNTLQENVEGLMSDIFKTARLPIVRDTNKGTEVVEIFPYLQEELAKIDPSVKVYPGGGLIRAAHGWISEQMINLRSQNPKIKTEDALQIVRGKIAKTPFYQIFGVASDIDIFLDSDQTKFGSLQQRAAGILYSVKNHFSLGSFGNFATRAIYPVPDIKDRREQTERSRLQGGSSLDWLVFDLQNQKLVSPQGHDSVFQEILKGFLPSERPVETERLSMGTLIRNFRALLEIPYLKFSSETQKYLSEQVRYYVELPGGARDPSDLDQLSKMTRNSRFSGANNRFFRQSPDSVEGLFLKLVRKIQTNTGGKLGQFADRRPLVAKNDLNELLIPSDRFISEYTADGQGLLMHGTRSLDNVLPILRNGLLVSVADSDETRHNSTAIHGDGVYLTKDLDVAATAAGDSGVILKVRIKKDSRLRILDLTNRLEDPKVKALQQDAARLQMGFHDYLSRVHSIDIVFNTYPILLNSSATEFTDPIGLLVESFATGIQLRNRPASDRLKTLTSYLSLHQYLLSIGGHNIPPASIFLKDASEISKSMRRHTVRFDKYSTLGFQRNDLVQLVSYISYIRATEPENLKNASELADITAQNHETILNSFEQALNDKYAKDSIPASSYKEIAALVSSATRLNQIFPHPSLAKHLARATLSLVMAKDQVFDETAKAQLLSQRELFLVPEIKSELLQLIATSAPRDRLIHTVIADAQWGDLPDAEKVVSAYLEKGWLTTTFLKSFFDPKSTWYRNAYSEEILYKIFQAAEKSNASGWKPYIDHYVELSRWANSRKVQTYLTDWGNHKTPSRVNSCQAVYL